MTWLKSDPIDGANRTARSRELRAKALSHVLTAGLAIAVPLLRILLLRRVDLVQEIVEALLRLSILYIIKPGTLLLRHSYLHLGQCLLFPNCSSQYFLFSVHVIITVEVDRLRSCCSISQVLLHFLPFEFVTLFLSQLIRGIKL